MQPLAPVDTPIEQLEVSIFRVPLDESHSDGTLVWDATTLVVVEVHAGGMTGLGYSATDPAAARLIRDRLAGRVEGHDAMDVPGAWQRMRRSVRNLGWTGLCAEAISAVDVALWDLKARLLGIPLAALHGPVRRRVPIYGSGGFTSFDVDRLVRQLSGWVEGGIPRVKMKVGRHPEGDLARVAAVREAIGGAELYVDANGAYELKQALRFAEAFGELGVSWLEEPITSDDLDGLRLMRERAPAGMEVAAGEYGFDLFYFRRMLEAGAVDVLQADAVRCGGHTGFLQVGTLCDAWTLELSSHNAPYLHLHACCAVIPLRHLEYFSDHADAERLLFDGTPAPVDGCLEPDWSRPGHGLELRRADAEKFRIS